MMGIDVLQQRIALRLAALHASTFLAHTKLTWTCGTMKKNPLSSCKSSTDVDQAKPHEPWIAAIFQGRLFTCTSKTNYYPAR
jgi:hypothetical protein